MSAPAYKINDRRSSTGYTGAGGRDVLIESARQVPERRLIQPADKDFHRNISSLGRRTLTTLGRWLFWNVPVVRGMVLEQADLAVGTFLPQFYGENKDWGNKAEEWLFDWHKIFDIAGPPFDYDFWLQSLILLPIVDGDFGTLLTSTDSGYPMIQIIPGHRIGGRFHADDTVKGGPYDGAKIIDGVIVNDYGRALAYRVCGDGYDPNNFQDISARDMMLHFTPLFPGQLRGISGLASSVFNFQDAQEWDRLEMLAQKIFASQTITEYNESGDVDEAKAAVSRAATYNTDDKKTSMTEESMEGGGMIRYFKANSGSKIDAFHYDRPGTATQDFQNRKIRDAFRGTQWDAFFSLDPQQVGGAPMRIIVAKINSVLKKLRKVAGKACARADGYGLSKSELPFDVDWYKWEYQGPGDITADAMYDSQVGLQETAQGFSSRKIQAAKRGEYWEELDAQREAEADSDLARARRLADKYKITIQEALVVLRPPTPNQQLPQPTNQHQETPPPKA